MSDPNHLKTSIASFLYHINTLYLFTDDQILDTVIPGTIFGLSAAFSGPVLDLPTLDASSIAQRLPAVWFWLWLMILQFCLQNQRHTSSVKVDAINKPWRPIPAQRMGQENAVSLLTCTFILSCVASCYLNVLPIYLAWTILGTLYNDLGGGDYSGLSRNAFCGALFCCTFSGALGISLGSGCAMSYKAWQWTVVMTLGVISSTIHTQDFRDEPGDRDRGRQTLVLQMGRKQALWSVITMVTFWSTYLPLVFFGGEWKTTLLSLLFGGYLSVMSMLAMGGHHAKRDRRLYKTWCLWIGVCCGLPALAQV
ncbi:UbiA prenyltransferase family-domain-containing protein [Phaeosphaeria sp. MPI-PUGE-AT-0046c]|nr:UbiA prenyltransferase family-domain-containing protein [Phaeosphaeria sp. MPI-PUGE-AT-0046c]